MPDNHFVTPMPLPTPQERELLTIFIEECAEAQQRATKMLRFGRDEVQPGQAFSNRARLGMEIGDLVEMIDRLIIAQLVIAATVDEGRNQKRNQLEKYLQHR